MDHQIELRHLRYFLAVAEELHFGRAAQRLNIAQPPLSQQIRRLEALIGYPLFERTSRSVKLTPAGTALVSRALPLLDRLNAGLEEVRSTARGEEGSLRVGFVSSALMVGLPEALRRYRNRFPGVDVQLRELRTSELAEAIRDSVLDAGLLRDSDAVDGLHIEPVHTEPFAAILPRHHRLARTAAVKVQQLRDEPFVFYPKSAGESAWTRTMALCRDHGFTPHITQEAPHWLTIVRLVAAGLGVTIAPACVAALARPGAVSRPLHPSATTEIQLAYQANSNNPLVSAFAVLIRNHLAPPSNKARGA